MLQTRQGEVKLMNKNTNMIRNVRHTGTDRWAQSQYQRWHSFLQTHSLALYPKKALNDMLCHAVGYLQGPQWWNTKRLCLSGEEFRVRKHKNAHWNRWQPEKEQAQARTQKRPGRTWELQTQSLESMEVPNDSWVLSNKRQHDLNQTWRGLGINAGKWLRMNAELWLITWNEHSLGDNAAKRFNELTFHVKLSLHSTMQSYH